MPCSPRLAILKRTLRYPVRSGQDTRWLSDPEVADRFQRRFTAQTEGKTRVAEVVRAGAAQLRRAAPDGIWRYAAVIPEVPLETSLSAETARDAEAWYRKDAPTSPLGRTLTTAPMGIPAPRRMTFTAQPSGVGGDPVGTFGSLVELYISMVQPLQRPRSSGTPAATHRVQAWDTVRSSMMPCSLPM